MAKGSSVTVYDPRNGRSYDVKAPGGVPLFASAALDLFVIEATGIDWDPQLIDRCLSRSGSYGFAAVSPWAPGTARLRETFRTLVGGVSRLDDFDYGVFPYDSATVRALLRLRADCGGWASGEWCIGACVRPAALRFDRVKELGGFPDGFALAQAESLGCALAMSEHRQSLLLTRLSTDVMEPLDALVHSLDADHAEPLQGPSSS